MKTKISFILNLVFAAILLMTSWYCQSNRQKYKNELQKNVNNLKQLIQARDDQGRMHSQIIAYQTTIKDLKSNEAVIEELKNENIRLKNLYSLNRLDFSLSGSFKVPTKDTSLKAPALGNIVDSSVNAYAFNFSDNFLSFSALVIPGDSSTGTYDYRDRFTLKKEWVRPKWNKPKDLIFSAYPQNPNAHFTDLQDITIKPPEKKWYETKAVSFIAGLIAGLLIPK